MTLPKIESNVCSFFNSFSTSTSFALFKLIFLLSLVTFISKSAYVTKFAHANLASKTSAVKLLNSGVLIQLS